MKTKLTYTPLPEGIVVTPHKDEESVTDTGLVVVNSVETKPSTLNGTVTAVGADVKDIAVSDTVVFPYFAGTEYNGHIFLKESEVLAVLA